MKRFMKSVLACALAFAMVLTVMPVNAYAANKKAVVVTNQKQLEKALKNGATNIVIKTNKNVKITIPATKKAAKASISVQAKNATITNKASVKSIVIKDAKAFVESGKNNDIKITDDKLSLTVAKGSKGSDIQIAKKDAEIKVVAKGDVASVTVAKTADVTLTVNKTATVASVNVAAKGASVDLNAKGTVSDVKVSEKAADTKLNINASGKVENVQIDAKADVAVAGSTNEAVKVTVNAKDTTIKAETAVETTLNADAKVDLSKGAEGSKVTTAENVKVDVANNTEDKVTVTDSTGKETSVDAGKTETTKDESKKDDEKKDDQKKDDQSSGGSSGGSSGTVTPTPTPTPDPVEEEGEVDSIYVQDINLVSVYLKDVAEVPDEFDASNMEIKDSNGSTLGVTSIKKDGNGYYVALSSDMVDGKYTLTMHLNGKKYVKDFTYDSETLSAIKAQAAKMIAESTGNEVVASVSALDTPVLFEDALLDSLESKFENLYTDDYEVVYQELLEHTADKATVEVKMGINLYYYNKNTQTNTCYESTCNVNFLCTGAEFVVSAPTIKYILRNSVVVEYERDYQYACVKADSDITPENIDDWFSDDMCGYCEIDDLEPNTKYRLYCIYDGATALSAYVEFSTSDEKEEAICIANANSGTTYDMKDIVYAGRQITCPVDVNTVAFGNYNREGLHGSIEFASDDKMLNSYLDSHFEFAGENDPSILFTMPKGLKNGHYEIKFNYYFVCNVINDDGSWSNDILAKSKPVTYTMTFDYNDESGVVEEAPKVIYELKNSIVIEAKEGMEYFCVEAGKSIGDAAAWADSESIDEFGNIEFWNLKTDTDYVIYASLGDDYISVYTGARTNSSVKNPVIALAEADGEKTISKDVTAGESVYIPLENLKIVCYGVPKDALTSIDVDVDLQACGEAASAFKVSVKKDDQGQICWLINIAKDVAAGSYQMTLKYSYGCVESEDDNAPMLAKSEPLVYEVTLNVK